MIFDVGWIVKWRKMPQEELFSKIARPRIQSIFSQTTSIPKFNSSFESILFFGFIALISAGALFVRVPVGFNSQGVVSKSSMIHTPVVERDGVITSIAVGRNPKVVAKGEIIARVKTLDSQSVRRSPNLAFTQQSLFQQKSRLVERKRSLEENFRRQQERLRLISSQLRNLISETGSRIELAEIDVMRAKEAEARIRRLFAQNNSRREEFEQTLDQLSQRQQVLGQLITQSTEYNRALLENELQIQKLEDDQLERTNAIEQKLADLATELRLSLELEEQIIVAPVAGTIVSRGFIVGQAVTKGNVLFEYTNTIDALQVEVDISESQIGLIKINTPILVAINSYPTDRFGLIKGRIVNISQIPNDQIALQNKLPAGSSFRILGQADSSSWTEYKRGKNIYQGMFADVRFETERLPIWRIIMAPIIRLSVNSGE